MSGIELEHRSIWLKPILPPPHKAAFLLSLLPTRPQNTRMLSLILSFFSSTSDEGITLLWLKTYTFLCPPFPFHLLFHTSISGLCILHCARCLGFEGKVPGFKWFTVSRNRHMDSWLPASVASTIREKHRTPWVGACNLEQTWSGKSLSSLPPYHTSPTNTFYFKTKSNKLILLDPLAIILSYNISFTIKLFHFFTAYSILNPLYSGLHMNHLNLHYILKGHQ